MRADGYRILLTFVLAATLLFCQVADTASAATTVGVIMTGDIPFYREIHKSFIETVAKRPMDFEGVEVLVQTPAPNTMSWVNAARKLVAIGADVIVAYGTPATLASLKETKKIPVVFAGVTNPEKVGAKTSNSTGISSTIPLAGIIKHLKGIYDFSKLGVVYNPIEKDTVIQTEEIKRLEGQFAFKTTAFSVRRLGDASKIKDVDALFITTSCAAHQCMNDIMGVARKHKLPTATSISGGQDKGVILTVSPVAREQGAMAAEIVAKILKGNKPASIPVEAPRKIEMIINFREATALGLKIPFDILTAATRIIK